MGKRSRVDPPGACYYADSAGNLSSSMKLFELIGLSQNQPAPCVRKSICITITPGQEVFKVAVSRKSRRTVASAFTSIGSR